ncbi:MAG: hypothetical protein A2Y25_04035 [Candidatus Melainabacteria bacterium GWF2_37_15]|nr:MAG: hypothetical protein A2Y25_04035 [Candidatus Melainabacteria bacterium GWF2_37_15]
MAEYKRWYDHDPLLVEVMELLRNFKDDLREQAQVFLEKIEAQVGKEAVESFYSKVKHPNGNRWYDGDPVLSRAVELLRIVPQDIQKKASENFLKSLKEQGITIEVLKSNLEE